MVEKEIAFWISPANLLRASNNVVVRCDAGLGAERNYFQHHV